MFKVVVDAFGGDHSPQEVVKGAVEAVGENGELFVTLVGREAEIANLLKKYSYFGNRIDILKATDIIENSESPTVAIRKKTESSLVKALEFLKENEDYCGLVSAGSTGAVLTGAFLKLGRLKGISRPALCPLLPTRTKGHVGVIDIGANMDAKPLHLLHFALMGSAYMRIVAGVENPRVALLNVGVEEGKGNELAKETFSQLKNLQSINFVGNMEARDVLSGDYDVVVSDGFSGNILLKSTEGAVLSLLKMMKAEIKASFWAKIGYLFMRPVFKNLKNTLDYSTQGGAVFLGCNKIVIKSHGSSKAVSIKESIFQVVQLEKHGLIEKLKTTLQEVEIEKLTELNN